jgi:hypothetical protein
MEPIQLIEFDLRGLHSTYERVVVDTLRSLEADYPFGVLKQVVTYSHLREGISEDESIANADEPGVIRLNLRWFGRPIDELRAEAQVDNLVYLRAGPPILWHGGMEEPHHVLAHEYAHQLEEAVSDWREITEPLWRAACVDPVTNRPVSGYACGGVHEFWADCFAAHRLGYRGYGVDQIAEFLGVDKIVELLERVSARPQE